MREIVAPLAVRFSGQNEAIDRVAASVDGIVEDVAYLKYMAYARRRPLSEATRRYYSATALMKVSVKQAPSLVLATDMVPRMAPIVRRTTVSPMPVPRPTALVV